MWPWSDLAPGSGVGSQRPVVSFLVSFPLSFGLVVAPGHRRSQIHKGGLQLDQIKVFGSCLHDCVLHQRQDRGQGFKELLADTSSGPLWPRLHALRRVTCGGMTRPSEAAFMGLLVGMSE